MDLDAFEESIKAIQGDCLHTDCKTCEFRLGCDGLYPYGTLAERCSRILEEIESSRQWKRLESC